MMLAADVATDKFDYAPGSTALISTFSDGGADHNFLVSETVRFQVVRTDGIADRAPGNLPWQVTDGVGGFAPYTDEAGRRIFSDTDGIADGLALGVSDESALKCSVVCTIDGRD